MSIKKELTPEQEAELAELDKMIVTSQKLLKRSHADNLKAAVQIGSALVAQKALVPHREFAKRTQEKFGYSSAWARVLMDAYRAADAMLHPKVATGVASLTWEHICEKAENIRHLAGQYKVVTSDNTPFVKTPKAPKNEHPDHEESFKEAVQAEVQKRLETSQPDNERIAELEKEVEDLKGQLKHLAQLLIMREEQLTELDPKRTFVQRDEMGRPKPIPLFIASSKESKKNGTQS